MYVQQFDQPVKIFSHRQISRSRSFFVSLQLTERIHCSICNAFIFMFSVCFALVVILNSTFYCNAISAAKLFAPSPKCLSETTILSQDSLLEVWLLFLFLFWLHSQGEKNHNNCIFFLSYERSSLSNGCYGNLKMCFPNKSPAKSITTQVL